MLNHSETLRKQARDVIGDDFTEVYVNAVMRCALKEILKVSMLK